MVNMADQQQKSNWRFPVGVTIFVVGFFAPAAIPLVTASSLPVGWKTLISGALAVGVPEVMTLAAAAVMGKEGFAELKRRLGRFMRKYGPPDTVGPVRYRVGLVMFVAPILVGLLGPYLHHHLPGFDAHPLWWHLGGDIVLVTSLFVLGGDFWDKLRSLFVREARAVFPATAEADGSDLTKK